MQTACEIFHKRVSSPRFEPPGGTLKEPDGRPKSQASQVGRYGGHGITLGLSIALFAVLGHMLDERLGTEPLFVLLGTFFGFGAGFYRMYRDLVLAPREDSRRQGDDSAS